MKYVVKYVKRLNKHLIIENFCYYRNYSLGILIGKTSLGFAIEFDLIFVGITVIV